MIGTNPQSPIRNITGAAHAGGFHYRQYWGLTYYFRLAGSATFFAI
jgi:hypothetical protein